LRCLSLGLETAENVHTFRVSFVGECVALVVAETPRKPTVDQVDAFTDITVRRRHKAALLSLQQGSKPDRTKAVSQIPLTARAHRSCQKQGGRIR
jgi:hypothetical protein